MKNDTQLKTDVETELTWEPSVNANQIGVEVKNGIVTLAGHVESYAEKWNAEKAVERVSGVRALALEIDVNLPGASRRSDTDIARSIESALEWTTYLNKNAVQVVVENGWVTLSGKVDWAYQRQAAASAVRYLMGVKGVTDNIVIQSTVSEAGVKADIEASLKRRAIADAQRISVDVHGADVTLGGNVATWTESDLARQSAWSTAGVRNVVNNIVVSW